MIDYTIDIKQNCIDWVQWKQNICEEENCSIPETPVCLFGPLEENCTKGPILIASMK